MCVCIPQSLACDLDNLLDGPIVHSKTSYVTSKEMVRRSGQEIHALFTRANAPPGALNAPHHLLHQSFFHTRSRPQSSPSGVSHTRSRPHSTPPKHLCRLSSEAHALLPNQARSVSPATRDQPLQPAFLQQVCFRHMGKRGHEPGYAIYVTQTFTKI